MLTESDLQTPAWLAAIASGSCVIIRGHVGERRLEGLKAILPLGAFQWAPIELPQGEALDPEFFASIMPSQPGEVPRKVYVMPLVASTVQIDALAEVRANQPWLQWIAVVPDPEIDPVLPGGILLFDAKARSFIEEAKVPAAATAWAKGVLGGARSEEEKRKAAAAEGPKILATINAVSAGDYQTLPGILGTSSASYVTQLATIASTIAGVEGVDPEAVAAEVEENASIEEFVAPNSWLPAKSKVPVLSKIPTSPNTPAQNPPARRQTNPHPQIFEDGKALPIYPPGDPVGKYARELDAVRRDPEAHGALLEVLQEFPCTGEDGQPRACADRCNDPAQKWACMRDNAWPLGMPAAIVDHWLEVFALMVARVGRKPREAYNSFANVVLQASAASPTFSVVEFEGLARQRTVPASVAPAPQSPKRPAIAAPLAPPIPMPAVAHMNVPSLPFLLKSQKLHLPADARVQKLSARLDALADRIERLKGQLQANGIGAPTPQPANDPLPGPFAACNWEADDFDDANFSLDALEKRVARLANGK